MVVFVAVLLVLPLNSSASHGNPHGPEFANPLDPSRFPDLAAFLNVLLDVIIIIGIPIVILAIIYVGFIFVTAQGN